MLLGELGMGQIELGHGVALGPVLDDLAILEPVATLAGADVAEALVDQLEEVPGEGLATRAVGSGFHILSYTDGVFVARGK